MATVGQIILVILLLIVGLLLYGFAKWNILTSETTWVEFFFLWLIGMIGVVIILATDRLLPQSVLMPVPTNRTRWIVGSIAICAGLTLYLWLWKRGESLGKRKLLILYGLMFLLFSFGGRVIIEFAP